MLPLTKIQPLLTDIQIQFMFFSKQRKLTVVFRFALTCESSLLLHIKMPLFVTCNILMLCITKLSDILPITQDYFKMKT